ncbi:MAG: hypothetical protein C0475_04475 [Planctomyces sp.]|nr:hypothetical protein [Planctomyces sp.]MBA4039143.1 hypothetical protein [Planctomyces sp.]
MSKSRHDRARLLALTAAAGLSLTGPALAQGPIASADAGAKDDGAMAIKVGADNLVELHVQDEPLLNVLQLLAVQAKRNIVVSKSVAGAVTADLYGVSFYDALERLLNVNGFRFRESGGFIEVYTAEEFAGLERAKLQREARVYRLSYLNATDAAEFIRPVLSPGAEIRAGTQSAAFPSTIQAPTGKDDYALGATLVVVDFPENLEAISKLLSELDTKPDQVLVQVTVMRATVSEDNAFGIDFSVIGDVDFSAFLSPLTAAGELASGALGINQGTAVTSSVGDAATGPATFRVGVISNNLAIVLRLLNEVTDTTIMANPKLLVLNRQSATVNVGTRVPYLSTTTTETAATQTVQFLDTGVQLYFRPFVAATGEIRMELRPVVSDAVLIPLAAGAVGASFSAPQEIRQELVTNVIVKDGQTVVLGGLFTEDVTRTRSQVPFLGDIPIVGTPFRGHDDSVDREEVVFFVTPSVVNDRVLTEQGDNAELAADRVRAGTRQGLLPFSRERWTAILNVEAEQAARAGDTDTAMWKIQRSLAMNPAQPDAIEIRERLVGRREVWPDRSVFTDIIDRELETRLSDAPPPNPALNNIRAIETLSIPDVNVKPEPKPKEQSALPKAPFPSPVLTTNPNGPGYRLPEPAKAAKATPAKPADPALALHTVVPNTTTTTSANGLTTTTTVTVGDIPPTSFTSGKPAASSGKKTAATPAKTASKTTEKKTPALTPSPTPAPAPAITVTDGASAPAKAAPATPTPAVTNAEPPAGTPQP